MSTLVPIKPATTSFNDQSHTNSSSTKDLLTLFEFSLLINPPYILTVSLDILLDPTYNQRKSLPRSQNSFILFRRDFEGRLRAESPNKSYTIHEISKIAGKEWKTQPDLVKLYFAVLAKLAQERHRFAFPGYTYKPRRTKQKKRTGEFLFKNTYKDTFASRQNNRVHAARGTISDTNTYTNTYSTIQHVDVLYRENESNAVCENTNNDTCPESLSQEDNSYDASSIQLPSPENSCNDITSTDSSLLYPLDQTNQYSTYDPFTFPIPNLFSSNDMLETIDFFNFNMPMAENSGEMWPAEWYDVGGYGHNV